MTKTRPRSSWPRIPWPRPGEPSSGPPADATAPARPEPRVAAARRRARPVLALLDPALARGAVVLGRTLRWTAAALGHVLRRAAVLLVKALAWIAVALWHILRRVVRALGRLLPPLAALLRRSLARGAVVLWVALRWTAAALGHVLRRAAVLLGKALVRIAVLLWVALAQARAARAVPRLVTVSPSIPWWLRDPWLRDEERPVPQRAPRVVPPPMAARLAAQPPPAMPEITQPLPAVPQATRPQSTRVQAGYRQTSRPHASAGRTGWRPIALVAAALVWTAAGVVLFLCYLRVSRTASVDSDGASNVLQAWDMLHGNPMLRGWRLSDVSFYTTELPQYMLVEMVRGISPDVVHIAGAITYSLLVLLTALLAKGRSAGRPGLFKAALAGGVMLAPQLGNGVYVLLLAPDHVGSTVPVMLVWLLLDRARRRWYVPAAAGVLLTWALIADNIVLITGVLPLAVVCAVRVYRATAVGRRPLWASWFELALITAAVIAAQLARTVLTQITAHDGFTVAPVDTRLAAYAAMPQHLLLAGQGMLLLFGADFFGHNLGLVSALAMLHVIGLVLAATATCAAIRRFVADRDLVTQILAAGVTVSLGAYLISHQAADLHSTREVAAVLPFTAALAGRVLGPRLERARMVPATALLLAGYLASLGRVMSVPPAAAQNQQLATWLSAHGLEYGLAGYWQAGSTTVASGGRVQVRPIGAISDGIRPFTWETDSSWYDPAAHDANFIALYPSRPGADPYPWITDVRAAFGQPARIYYVYGYTVMVWNDNLLTELSRSVP